MAQAEPFEPDPVITAKGRDGRSESRTSAAQCLATDVVVVGIGVTAAFAFQYSLGIRLLERWLVPWKGSG